MRSSFSVITSHCTLRDSGRMVCSRGKRWESHPPSCFLDFWGNSFLMSSPEVALLKQDLSHVRAQLLCLTRHHCCAWLGLQLSLCAFQVETSLLFDCLCKMDAVKLHCYCQSWSLSSAGLGCVFCCELMSQKCCGFSFFCLDSETWFKLSFTLQTADCKSVSWCVENIHSFISFSEPFKPTISWVKLSSLQSCWNINHFQC